VPKEIWAHVPAYDLLRAAMAVAAAGVPARGVGVEAAEQAVTAFAPKIEAARPADRPPLIDAVLAVVADHRVGDRPGRWEPRARKRRPKPGSRPPPPRAAATLRRSRKKWDESVRQSRVGPTRAGCIIEACGGTSRLPAV
jgi:hypothetical protein